ncbi:hypothetical protein OIE13_22825 [Streptosporangium sp. NBC_01810]|uniref:hypothetical protein n=1 Tax=Streptosporangium sp. NBC_01810 TaxID=2975951 RepID=UPI002DD93B23|nr:hypothetical protein [Streptosporangium sp. NBC_01810]WSA23780.1 hypothetical protein OIE13_22825 [Streptosporangium sp. NBC_01810]
MALALTCLSLTMWAAVGAEVSLLDITSPKAFDAILGIALTVSGWAIMMYHSQCVKQITKTHAETIAKQVLTIDRFFALGVRSDLIARLDVAATRSMNGFGANPVQTEGRPS